MKFYVKSWAFLFLSSGYSPEKNTVKLNNNETKVTVIGLDPNQIDRTTEIAKQLVADGVQVIELCGGFGPQWVTKIKEATNYKIPVGTVMYGPEDRAPMLEIVRGAEVKFPE